MWSKMTIINSPFSERGNDRNNRNKERPHMFFAYYNDIAATADAMELDGDGDIRGIPNLQIVNGGQTYLF